MQLTHQGEDDSVPPAVVVQLGPDAYHIALRTPRAWQEDGRAVVLYELAPGLPYRSARDASQDALLILRRYSQVT